MGHLSAASDTVRVGSEQIGESRFATEYEIEAIEGNFTRKITVIEEKTTSRYINGVEKLSVTRSMKTVDEPFTKGFMIYYPQAHSIFVAADDTEQLAKLGIVLDEDGDLEQTSAAPPGMLLSAKEAVLKSEGRKRRSTVGGIEEAMKG